MHHGNNSFNHSNDFFTLPRSAQNINNFVISMVGNINVTYLYCHGVLHEKFQWTIYVVSGESIFRRQQNM